jgi:la-related protein 1
MENKIFNPVSCCPPMILVHEPYSIFRKRVLYEQKLTPDQDDDREMDVLCQFWSHFLVPNFNAQMYNGFKSLALDDLSFRNASSGFNRLVRFYGAFLSCKKILPDEVVEDLLVLCRRKLSSHLSGHMAFDTLRSAWHSQACDAGNRLKIDSLLDASLRAELEK